jgi:hypothetical protein
VRLHSGAARFQSAYSLGGVFAKIDEAVANLNKFAKNIDKAKMDLPKSLNVITGTGMSYRRPDGVNVISIASLGK